MKDKEARGTGLPTWLDGQTVAIIGTVLTVAVGISAMVLVSMAGIRAEISDLREEMNSQIGGLREESNSQIGGLREEMNSQIDSLREEMYQMRTALTRRLDALDVRVRGLERALTRIEHDMKGMDNRLRVVEAHRRQPLETPPDG